MQKLPITLIILWEIYGELDLGCPADLSFWSACLICFYGLLRKSTLLPLSARSSTSLCLCRGDVVKLGIHSFLLRIRHSKTIQFGQRLLTIPFVSCDDAQVCPVAFLIRHLAKSNLQKDFSLFSYIDKGRVCSLTHSIFVSKLRHLLGLLGYPPAKYSGHSFRRGGCTACYQAGLSLTEIKLRGDWKSQAFEQYLFIPAESVFEGARLLSSFASTSCV